MFINPYHIDEDLFAPTPAENVPPAPFVDMVRSRMLHEVLADTLRAMLLNGSLLSGDRLDEEALAKTYGIARPPVHEALKILSREGLVEVTAYGCRVAMPSADEIAFARESLALLERGAKLSGVPFDTLTLQQAATGDPAALPAAPTERLLISALIPVWRRLRLAQAFKASQQPLADEPVR